MTAVVFEFEKLEVYQAARAFRGRITKLAGLLPSDERYRLRSQMRRAGLSLTNAIAEGHGRYTFRDRLHYCHEARGSLQELVDDISACADHGYAKAEHLDDLRTDAHRLLQLVDGWARYLRREHGKLQKAPRRRVSSSLAADLG
jgi:four helix bundle protein